MATSPTFIDRVVAAVSPRAGILRHYYREQLSRAYEAAAPRDKWRPRRAGASANADHMADAKVIRDKARSLVQNVPYIAAGLEQKVAHVVGNGIGVRWDRSPELNARWAEWKSVCDADGKLDFDGLVRLAERTVEVDGEVLVRLRPRRVADSLPVPLQLQLLEVDWLDTSRQSGALSGNVIIGGIEYDLIGRVVAYWLYDHHPGDVTLPRGFRLQSKRIPAESIIHLFDVTRPGQGRGISRLAPIIASVRDLQLYEDAEIARKNLEARLSVLVSGDPTSLANPAAFGGQADPSNAARTGDLGQLASGSITQIPPGMNVTTVAPQPAPGHVQYVKLQQHKIAAGWGVTYEMLTGDMSEVNFSSARVRMLQFRRWAEAEQWLLLVPRLLAPVASAFADAYELVIGQSVHGRDSVAYSPPKWDYVNPGDEIDAALAEIGGGLTSMSEQIRRRGDLPETVFAQIESDAKRLGIKPLELMQLMLSRGRLAQSQPAAVPAKSGASP